MRQSLPYSPDLGSRLRRQSRPTDQSVWLRLGPGGSELFCAFPIQTINPLKQSVNKHSESAATGPDTVAETWREARRLLATLPPCKSLQDLPFRGGVAGFVGYGESPDPTNKSFPLGFLGLFTSFIHIDPIRRMAEFITLPGTVADERWQSLLDSVSQSTFSPAAGFGLAGKFHALTPPDTYAWHFRRIQDYLREGDCYQVNYAQAFRARCHGSSAAAMDRLLAESDAPYAAWVSIPEGDVLSLSPELFLDVRGGRVTTRPIKGTAPRGSNAAADEALRAELAGSAKNRAENLMIVDLLRHDLGQHAETGSVRVERLFEVETLANVHHLVSTITCSLKKESHVTDLIADSFPGGSITGAPKRRAMEIIAELEPTPRSVYCGSIGFINADGDAQLNIAIRTLLRLGDDIYAWAGGGIVADSGCEAEYQECFHKIGAFMRALEGMEGDAPAPGDTAGK